MARCRCCWILKSRCSKLDVRQMRPLMPEGRRAGGSGETGITAGVERPHSEVVGLCASKAGGLIAGDTGANRRGDQTRSEARIASPIDFKTSFIVRVVRPGKIDLTL